MSIEQVAEHLMCSPSKVNRMEAGFRAGTVRDVRDLCGLYGVAERAQREQLMGLAREARQQGWWQPYELAFFATYVGLEAAAVSLKVYECSLVHGLLQTADYTRILNQTAAYPGLSAERVEQLVEVRLTRQLILTGENPPHFHPIIDEAVLRRSVGGPEIMRAQLDRMVEVARLPNVTLQVIPDAAGANPALGSSFTILQFSSTPAVVYTEGLIGNVYMERPNDVERYNAVFDILSAMGLNEDDSIDFIKKLRRDMA